MTKTKTKVNPFSVRRTSKVKLESFELPRAVYLMKQIAKIKGYYRELDEIVDQLVAQGFTEAPVGNRRLVLRDNFATKNTVWKSTPSRRFELELT